jgi:hypothetical protein
VTQPSELRQTNSVGEKEPGMASITTDSSATPIQRADEFAA